MLALLLICTRSAHHWYWILVTVHTHFNPWLAKPADSWSKHKAVIAAKDIEISSLLQRLLELEVLFSSYLLNNKHKDEKRFMKVRWCKIRYGKRYSLHHSATIISLYTRNSHFDKYKMHIQPASIFLSIFHFPFSHLPCSLTVTVTHSVNSAPPDSTCISLQSTQSFGLWQPLPTPLSLLHCYNSSGQTSPVLLPFKPPHILCFHSLFGSRHAATAVWLLEKLSKGRWQEAH